jgi:WhiB family transcriptional regulator, redox-sensing transcriptional regulator
MEAFMHKRSDGDWRNYAECRKNDPELFFPDRRQYKRINDAKRICGKCAVRLECLNFAEVSNSYFGVWGGRSEEERENDRAKAKKRAS